MKALVTGGSGFIGSHLVDRLRARGIQVRIFDMIYPSYRTDIEFYHGSLLDLVALTMAMGDVDVVYHLAAVADVKDVFQDPHYAEGVNVRGTINVLEAARRAKVKRVIYGSTTWVYSEAVETCVDEQTSLKPPTHLYTATKIASEYYCQCYSRLYGLPTTILRYGIPYGPRSRDGAVIPIFVSKAMKGEPITIAGDGSQFRKFVYVEDLAEGNVLALKSAAVGQIYNLDGFEKVTIRRIADIISRLIGGTRIEHTLARPGDFSGKDVSSRKARMELGWEPKVAVEEGIRLYIEWFKEREMAQRMDWSAMDSLLSAPAVQLCG